MSSKSRGDQVRRVGIIFSGGPAPGANAVISSAATSFIQDGREVLGFYHGYSALQDYHSVTHRLVENEHYRVLRDKDLSGLRNSRGIIIGTARTNPGADIEKPEDLADPKKTERLRAVYNALLDHHVDALISIGGDDTLKTANYLALFQNYLPEGAKRIRIVHLPKTIDNDYRGIDFTFGFFTAVDVMAKEILNLRADAMATSSYFIVQTMGRKAGWLSYGVAIAGEANLVLALEDVDERLTLEEMVPDPDGGEPRPEKRLDLKKLADKIVDLILHREKLGKHYGTVVLAEGLSELLPESFLATLPRDEHGHLSLGRIDLGMIVAELVAHRHEERTGQRKKLTGVQFGYESRCAPPHAFDVMLGSQLGIGAYRALVEEGLDQHMVSISGQLDLEYVPFDELINQETLVTEVRYIKRRSDFHRLARFLELRSAAEHEPFLPRRRED